MKNFKFMNFSEFLFEGGNARITDRESGEILVRSQKIDLKKFDRSELVESILEMLQKLNQMFKKKYGKEIWKDLEILRSGHAFSGSSEFFIDQKISDQEFLKFKPFMGDIDVIIPENLSEDFREFMPSLAGRKITSSMTYLGQDRVDFKSTWLGIFNYKSADGELNLQIDFEFGEWDVKQQSPTEWAKFSHGSSWEDIKQGMKGVHHKFLIINLTRALSKRDDVIIATPASTPEKIRLVSGKKAESTPRMLAFSVDKGLRFKYKQMEDENAKPIRINKKIVFQEVPASKSEYYKTIPQIFSHIFGENPTKKEIEDFKSFEGLIKIAKDRLSKEEINSFFDFLLEENLFGNRAQKLERNPDFDSSVKWTMVDKLIEIFPFLEKRRKETEKLSKEYYKNFSN